MNSLSKTHISKSDAQTILSQHIGGTKNITFMEELKEGFFNAAYHIKLEDGFQGVLKIAPPPEVKVLRYEKDILRTEVEAMRIVKNCTEMPVPEIFFFDESYSLVPSPYFCMEFVNGIPLNKIRDSLTIHQQAKIDMTTGYYLSQMNRLTATQFGCYAHPEPLGVSWSLAFEKLIDNVLLDAMDAAIKLPLPPRDIISLTRKYATCLEEVSTPRLVHWDLWDGNIFIDPQTNHINGIIDFERCLWADPLMEVNFGAFEINHNFLKGYGKYYPFSASEEIRRTLYNIYLFLIMVIESTYRNYPTNDQENWARQKLSAEISKLQ